MSPSPSICFLGTGAITRKHIRTVQRLFPKIPLAIASRDAARATAFKENFNLRASFANYRDAIDSPFNTLVIGVPPHYHAALVQEALTANKNLLIEKPIFQSLAEFTTLWPLLAQGKTTVMVAENQVFDPFYQRIKACLSTHDFGKPLFLELTRLGIQHSPGWRADSSQMPLGALHEGGVHWIRKLLDLAAIYEPDRYSVVGVRAYRPAIPLTTTPNEDTMFVVARHRSGLVSRLFHSWGIPRRTGLFDLSKLLLEKGALYFESRGLIGISLGAKRKLLWPQVHDIGGYRSMWKHFIHCLSSGEKPCLSLDDIFYDFSFLDAAYRSLTSGKEESLNLL